MRARTFWKLKKYTTKENFYSERCSNLWGFASKLCSTFLTPVMLR